MTLSEELTWRGFVNQTTLKDLKQLDKAKRTFYHGYDASANSQTIGNLAAMMFDKVFMRHGYQAIILAGGSTSLIGDPGGKYEERQLQSEAAIAQNVAAAEDQLKQVFNEHKFTLVNNLDWTKDLKVLPFLRDVGKHFSMTPLIQRDYITTRLGLGGSGISYAEFSYTILQGYDYLHLFDNYGTTLQLGGSDQWGNCLSGVELIRKVRGKEVDAMTMNLVIDNATGQKFGKSEAGAIWLDPSMTSPHDFYQFWVNVDDDSVGEYLKIYTELDQLHIAKVMTDFEKDKPSRWAQKTLAYEVTKIVHGEDEAEKARSRAQTITSTTTTTLPPDIYISDGDIASALIDSGLANSKSEARKLLGSGGVYINGKQTTKERFEQSDVNNGFILLRRGKTLKNTAVIRLKLHD
ncbi:MAG TPA: tyrosine--tRNA ligase [Candidatus Saccharimonadales bacterium]|nr:tyrosine--tRNA ligase [Candidatus Saccharimonadales bacterium]